MQSRQHRPPARKHSLLEMLLVMALFYGVVAVVNVIFLGKAEFCFFRMLCGLPCPGCGLTHSTIALVKGSFRESLSYCPFTIFMLATVASGIVCYFAPDLLPHRLWVVAHFLAYNRYWHFALGLAFFLLYVVRMVLYFPDGPYPMIYASRNYLSIIYRIVRYCLTECVGKIFQ